MAAHDMIRPRPARAGDFQHEHQFAGLFDPLEDCSLPLLPADRYWRFQRLIDFRAREAVLQLWEEPGNARPAVLVGQLEPAGNATGRRPVVVQRPLRTVRATNEPRSLSFHPATEEEVDREAETIAQMWPDCIAEDG